MVSVSRLFSYVGLGPDKLQVDYKTDRDLFFTELIAVEILVKTLLKLLQEGSTLDVHLYSFNLCPIHKNSSEIPEIRDTLNKIRDECR